MYDGFCTNSVVTGRVGPVAAGPFFRDRRQHAATMQHRTSAAATITISIKLESDPPPLALASCALLDGADVGELLSEGGVN